MNTSGTNQVQTNITQSAPVTPLPRWPHDFQLYWTFNCGFFSGEFLVKIEDYGFNILEVAAYIRPSEQGSVRNTLQGSRIVRRQPQHELAHYRIMQFSYNAINGVFFRLCDVFGSAQTVWRPFDEVANKLSSLIPEARTAVRNLVMLPTVQITERTPEQIADTKAAWLAAAAEEERMRKQIQAEKSVVCAKQHKPEVLPIPHKPAYVYPGRVFGKNSPSVEAKPYIKRPAKPAVKMLKVNLRQVPSRLPEDSDGSDSTWRCIASVSDIWYGLSHQKAAQAAARSRQQQKHRKPVYHNSRAIGYTAPTEAVHMILTPVKKVHAPYAAPVAA